ncbi:expressed unknown protein (Partial), partial [Seminavis robusta]|eukprot:Sro247_g097920.1 n/a (160) ;mRNA; r:2-481
MMMTSPRRNLLVWHGVAILWAFCVLSFVGGFSLSTTFTKPTANKNPHSLLLFAVDNKNDNDNSHPFFAIDEDDTPLPSPTSTPLPSSTSSPPPSPSNPFNKDAPKGEIILSQEAWELVIAIWDVAGELAKRLFFAMRRTAAGALTASLPEDERQELLERT